MKKKVLTIAASVFLLIIAIYFSVMMINKKAKAETNSESQSKLKVKTGIVKNEINESDIQYTGRVGSFQSISVSAEVNGKIMSGDVPFKEGQSFRKGDLLIHIYSEDAEAGLKASKSSYLRTLSTILPDLSVDYPGNYQKWLDFFNSINLDKKLPKLPDIGNEQVRVFLASNGVISEYYSLLQQEINLTKYEIYAPFDGYFKSVNKEVGAIATNGAELAVIIREDKLEVTVPVNIYDVKRITVNKEVTLKSGDNRFSGTVSRIAGFVDESTQSVNVYITINNAGKINLLEGEYVDVIFESDIAAEGFVIPREAVADNNKVYLVKDGRLKLNPVDIARQMEDYAVVAGLQDGDTIVVESLTNVKEGQTVGIIQ